MQRLLRAGEIVNRILSWSAPLLIVLFLVEALWLRGSLGHWPVVYRDQANGAVAAALEASTGCLAVGLFLAAPIWAVSLVCVAFLRGRGTAMRRLVLFAGSAALIVAGVVLNPVGFPEWWLD